MIEEAKFKKFLQSQTESRIFSRKKTSKTPKIHYLINGKEYGHWAEDWLTIWQRKNEQ